MSKKVAIYELSFLDGEYYIGYSYNPEERLKAHKDKFKTEDITLKVIEWVVESKQNYWEKYYINHYLHIGHKLKNKNAGSGNKKSLAPDSRLTKKLQVLISAEDEKNLFNIIMTKALIKGGRPTPISLYVREIILAHIEKEKQPQKSFAVDKARNVIEAYEQEKEKSKKPKK